MGLERTITRSRVIDRSTEVLHDVWVSTRNKTPDSKITESMDEIVWVAGKEGRFTTFVAKCIEESEDFICFSTFLFGDELIEKALIDASNRGVRVYMLCPSEKIDKEYEDEEDIDERAEEHKDFLNRVGGRILIRSAEHLHSKFILIDPKNPKKRIGFLSTANFNRALYDNPEIMVKLESTEIDSLFIQFIHGFWEQAQSEHVKIEEGEGCFPPVSKPPQELSTGMTSCHLPVTVKSSRTEYENLSLRKEITNFISSTEGPLIISTFGVDNHHDVTKAIINAAKTRKITLVIPLRPANSEACANLCKAGVTVLGIDRLHAKVMIGERDGTRVALLMTANLQPKGLDTGYETGIMLKGDRLLKVTQILENWIQSAQWIYKDSVEIGNVTKDLLISRDIPTPKGKVQRYVEEKISDLIEEELPDVLQLSLEIEPEPVWKKTIPLSRKVIYSWKVIRPVLPKDAKRIDQDGKEPFQLFKKGNQIFIIASEENEILGAVELKKSKHIGARIVLQ